MGLRCPETLRRPGCSAETGTMTAFHPVHRSHTIIPALKGIHLTVLGRMLQVHASGHLPSGMRDPISLRDGRKHRQEALLYYELTHPQNVLQELQPLLLLPAESRRIAPATRSKTANTT